MRSAEIAPLAVASGRFRRAFANALRRPLAPMKRTLQRLLAAAVLGIGLAQTIPAAAQATPALLGAASRKLHGGAGAFDLALVGPASSPTTEPRLGPSHSLVFTFDGPVTGGTATLSEGTAILGTPSFNGVEMTVPLTGVANAQYVTVDVSYVTTAGGGAGGQWFGSDRLSRRRREPETLVTVADLGLVNAQARATRDRREFSEGRQCQRHIVDRRQGTRPCGSRGPAPRAGERRARHRVPGTCARGGGSLTQDPSSRRNCQSWGNMGLPASASGNAHSSCDPCDRSCFQASPTSPRISNWHASCSPAVVIPRYTDILCQRHV